MRDLEEIELTIEDIEAFAEEACEEEGWIDPEQPIAAARMGVKDR